MNKFYQTHIKFADPESKKPLTRISIENIKFQIFDAINKLNYVNLEHNDVTALWLNQTDNKYFLEVDYIPIFIKEIYLIKQDNKILISEKRSLFNPFEIMNYNNINFYHNYEKIVNFKTRYFEKKIKSLYSTRNNNLINAVELMSSEGSTIESLKKNINNVKFVALDIDFKALKNTNNYTAVCADVNFLPFENNSIDIFFSNSFHHIPETALNAWEGVYSSLKENGNFYGVETQGLFSKIVLYFFNIFPYTLIPKSFWEIKNEYKLISSWLSIPLNKRFRMSKINFSLKFKKNLFYIFYEFKKKND